MMFAQVSFFLSWKCFYLIPPGKPWEALKQAIHSDYEKGSNYVWLLLGFLNNVSWEAFKKAETDHVYSSEQSLPQREKKNITAALPTQPEGLPKIQIEIPPPLATEWFHVVCLHSYVFLTLSPSLWVKPVGAQTAFTKNGAQWPDFHPKIFYLFTYITPFVVCILLNEQMALPP